MLVCLINGGPIPIMTPADAGLKSSYLSNTWGGLDLNRQNINQVHWNICAGVLRRRVCGQNSQVICSETRWRSIACMFYVLIFIFETKNKLIKQEMKLS